MFLKFYPPHPLLQPLVSSVMLFAEQFSPAGRPLSPIPYPPLPEHSLFFYPRSPILATMQGADQSVLNPNSIFVGPQLKRVNIVLGQNHLVIRVGFKPGGLHRLIGLPMHEIIDLACDSADFFHHQVKQVNEQLFNTNSYDGMVAIVEQFLLHTIKAVKPLMPIDHAMEVLMRKNGLVSVEQLASMACVSTRQLERLSNQRIGLPPKLFARLIRFSKAYRLFESSPNLRWTQIAHCCGYYDQMHFIRDCKEFAGVSPSVIAKDVTDAPAQLQFMLQL